MRILYSHRVQSRDGQGVHIEELVRAFRDAGHEVLMVGPGFYDEAGFGGESALVASARRMLPQAAYEWAEIAYDYQAYRRLKRAWRAFRPDFVYERCNLYFTAGARLARETGAVLFLEVNSPLAEERAAHGGLRLADRARRMEHATWRAATRVLPVTRVLADIVAEAGVARDRITVMPNGVDLARFPIRTKQEAADGPIEMGFVGFVRAWHGLDRVIQGMATAANPALSLTIVGDGPARPELEALAGLLGVADRVRFTGVVPPEEVAGYVARFDIALQPSATPYASPLKIFDYMAAGCAILAPDQPNIREVLTHMQTALLFNPGNPAKLWGAVELLIAKPGLRRRLGNKARALLEREERTWAGNAGRIVALAEAELRPER